MADKEVGSLTSAGTLDGTELIHVVKSGNSRQTTAQDIADLGGGGGGGGGLVWLASTDLSGDATANFTAFDAGSYDAYLFVLQNVIPASDNQALYVRTSTDGGSSYDSGGSDYSWACVDLLGAPSSSGQGANSAAQIQIARTVGNQTGEDGASGCVWVISPHLARKTTVKFDTVMINGAGFITVNIGGGYRSSSADVDAIQFLFASGNLASGTITMYGLVNA